MLTTILHILSIIGWILFGLLGFLVILLLLVLFFPIFYDAFGLRSTDIPGMVRLKAGWLLGLLRVRFTWPEEDSRIQVKLLFFTLYDSKAPKKKAHADKKEAKTDSEEDKPSSSQTAYERLKHMTSEETQQIKNEKDTGAAQSKVSNQETVHAKHSTETSSASSAARTSIFDKILNLYHRFRYTISHLCATIKKLKGQADYYLALLQEEETRQLFSHVKLRIFKVFRSIRPRKVKGHITFGTGSPDTTGYGMAVYGMLSPLLGKDILVTPDFEDACLYGEVRLKGHITIGVLLFQGLRLLLDKKLRRFIKKMKQGGSDNGR